MGYCGVCSQKLLVGDFPHEMDVEEMEEDVPKRKNRTKGRVCRKNSNTQHNARGAKT